MVSTPCSTPGCDQPARARGRCLKCYDHARYAAAHAHATGDVGCPRCEKRFTSRARLRGHLAWCRPTRQEAAPVSAAAPSIANEAEAKAMDPVVVAEAEERATPAPKADDGEANDGRFARVAAEIGRLVDEKNRAYGDSFARSGEVLRILYPDGVPVTAMDDALAVVRVIDKLFRIATRKDAFAESPWQDIAGYGVLGAARDERKAAMATRTTETRP